MPPRFSPLSGKSIRFGLALAVAALLSTSLGNAQTYGPNLLPSGSFSDVLYTYVPWAGVDDRGNIHGIDGMQISVGEDGSIRRYPFGSSVAVGDLNGDGKPDLVLADSEGFFWYYPNSGTPQKPAFTQGEVIPIWLGAERVTNDTEGVADVVPRIQLIDLDGSKKFNILAGTYMGKLYDIPNVGSGSAPNFRPTIDREIFLINTRRQGALWCNYLAPFMTTAFGSGNQWDLVMGEGTYSANSIYLLRSTSTGPRPSYDEDHIQKIIPGMGLEQLTPAVLDWNNDGKPDIISGDRTGYVHLYLNNSSDPTNPTFAPTGNGPTPLASATDDIKSRLTIGGLQKLGNSVTASVGDLTGNHLPNLLIGKDDGSVLYALNTGTPGNPQFTTPATPLKGVLPPTYHYTSLRNWVKSGAWGAPDELVGAVNPQNEPGFTFPEGEQTKYALKFWVWPVTNVFFPVRYYPPTENFLNEHVIRCVKNFPLELNKQYRIHMWVKCDHPVQEFRYRLDPGSYNRIGFQPYAVMNPIDCGTSWTEFSSDVKISNPDDPTLKTWNYWFEFRFQGQSTFYADDVQIQLEQN